MSERAKISVGPRRFRTSVMAMLSAVCLLGSIQALVSAAEEPLRAAAFYVINWVIVHGRWGALPVSVRPPIWIAAVLDLGIAAVTLGFGLSIARWNSRKPAS